MAIGDTRQQARPSKLGFMRYPFTAFPDSWFRIAFSDEITHRPGSPPRALRYLGQELLLYRGADGQVRATSTVCPHLGADLTQGRVVGDRLECPFHGWRFDGERCVEIPYCAKAPSRARLRSWPVRELNGMIFVHPGQPRFELPGVPELGARGWTRPHRLGWRIRMHVQEIAENAVDFGHYSQVHAYTEYPRETALTVEGHEFCVSLAADRPVLGQKGPTRIQIRYSGMGLAVARVWSRQVELIALLTPTPVDEEMLDVRMSVMFKKTGNPLKDLIIGTLIPRDIREDFSHDIPIWENKAYLAKPVLCGGDGPILKIRRWAEQFYGQGSAKAAS